MANFEYEVPRITDGELFGFLLECAKAITATHVNIQEAGRPSTFSVNVDAPEDETLKAFANSSLYTIDNANLGARHYNLTIQRNKTSGADFAFDKLTISSSNAQHNDPTLPLDPSQIHAVNELINRTFLARTEQSAGLFHNSKSFTLLMRSHQKMMEQMQQTITNVGEQAASVRLKLEQEFDARKKAIDDELQLRRDELEQRAEGERERLDERQAELDAFKKDLDDRSNTFARRDLHKSLKARIADRAKKFEITPETKESRRPIHAGVIGGMVLLIGLVFYYSRGISVAVATNNVWAIVAVSVKPALLTLALLGLLTWYLRWMNRWFERYADAEFSLKQFELDIDRASWVVETALEWKQFQDVPMPEHLLENISRNLFTRSEKDESADMHPADFLASAIMGRASGVNLKVPGAELTFTGKDIKKLQHDEA